MPKPNLERLEKDLKMYIQHLKETGNAETRLRELSVGFVLGLIYGEYEKCIRDSIVQRAKRTGDDHLVQYVKLSVKQLGMVQSKLMSVYYAFGGDPKKTRSDTLKTAWSNYDKLRDLRNMAMHGKDVSEGLDTVLEMHGKAKEAVYSIREMVFGDTKQDTVSYDDYSNNL